MEAQGMDGRAVADDAGITLSFGGIQSRPAKRAASPHHLPWGTITSVTFSKGGLKPGHLRVNTVSSPSATEKPELDRQAILVNVGKQTDSCRLFAEQVNERLRMRPGAEPGRAEAGDQARSVADARDRVNVKFGSRRELRKLKQHLLPGEVVRYAAGGRVDNRLGLIALTDRRLLVLFAGMLSQKVEEIPLDQIVSTKEKKGLLLASLSIRASNTELTVTQMAKLDQQSLVTALRTRISTGSLPPLPPLDLDVADGEGEDDTRVDGEAGPAEPSAAGQEPSPAERLRELAQLHADGVLSDAEFATAKARIIDAM